MVLLSLCDGDGVSQTGRPAIVWRQRWMYEDAQRKKGELQ